ncbi:gp16 family protein [Rhodanobacter denitrificans]|uniref:Mu-like prophage protein gp16 n=1 Tax=Rhodanobacter denitrificans TaxID=666685 RepID=M4NQN0_9GAMM|nr:regulatory protein GemA [Rhodanobacter denitrificans]AGG89901.1 Mu-like prophage protein gp16 [Rhodanobacter denitrificans]UJM85297.1 regulatory protein GemA [Rhodanobacter denitrificans]
MSLTAKAKTQRNRELAAIHVLASKRLHLDRDTYVALLQRVGNVRSSADLDQRGRAQVLDELRRLAGEGQQQMRNAVNLPDAPQNVRDEIAGMVSKVGALLAEAGKSWNYAHGTAQRMFKVHRVEWLRADQLHKLVAALSYAQKRQRKTKGE